MDQRRAQIGKRDTIGKGDDIVQRLWARPKRTGDRLQTQVNQRWARQQNHQPKTQPSTPVPNGYRPPAIENKTQ